MLTPLCDVQVYVTQISSVVVVDVVIIIIITSNVPAQGVGTFSAAQRSGVDSEPSQQCSDMYKTPVL